jgi:hypothetical protein
MKKNRMDEKPFTPHDISLRDDALHRMKGFHIETFYYDAVFDNHFSIVSLVNVFTMGCYGVVLTGMFVYNDSKLVKSKRDKSLYQHLTGSEHYPHITLHNKDIIRLINDTDTTPWFYAISMGDVHEGFSLRFLQKTSAWKGKTALGQWLVLPRFDVQGDLYLDGKTIPVQGRGYHDHNIYSFFSPLKMVGYHFGKIVADDSTITWARLMKRDHKEQIIAVVNKDQTYLNIPPSAIRFTIENQIRSSGKLIPEAFRLEIQNEDISLDVTLKTVESHLIKMPFLRYWRSHVQVKGTLQMGSVTKNINDIEITELLQFL